MNPARLFTLLGLAVIVVAFAVTWLSLPSRNEGSTGYYSYQHRFTPGSLSFTGYGYDTTLWTYHPATKKVAMPASWFAAGLTHSSERFDGRTTGSARGRVTVTVSSIPASVELHALKQRIVIVFASAAAVVLLVGLAFGAARRSAPI